MKELSIKKIAEIIGAATIPQTDRTVQRICIDSRTAQAGDCFFAIKGDNFDGHDFVDTALAAGAVCAVVSDARKAANVLNVTDTVQSLGILANYYRRQTGYKVVAITGSAGKTTTKNMIYHVLSRHFSCHKAPESFNNNIGVPLTLLGAEADCEIVITEIGSNHPGEIQPLSIMAEPDIAVITNVYPTHLDGFGSIETIIKEKCAITEGLGNSGKFLINNNFEQLKSYCDRKKLPFITFDCTGTKFSIDGMKITLPVPGAGNVENAVAAWTVCSEFGITAETFAEAIRTFSAAEMRMEILKFGQLTVLNDCYNANPASMANAAEVLRIMAEEQNRRAVFICGTMAELASQSRMYHVRLGGEIAEMKIELLMTAGPLAAETARTAKTTAGSRGTVEIFENITQLCDNLVKFIEPDDIVLVKASRSEKFEAVTDRLKDLFDI